VISLDFKWLLEIGKASTGALLIFSFKVSKGFCLFASPPEHLLPTRERMKRRSCIGGVSNELSYILDSPKAPNFSNKE